MTRLATIFPKTSGLSSYSARKPSSFSYIRHPDSSYALHTVMLSETRQTAINGPDLYEWFISGDGNMKHLVAPFVSTSDVPIIESVPVVSLIVESFFHSPHLGA